MGAYLSEPITEKVSTDETGKRVKCGASSMQGWRVSQEDAHNCVINYDDDTSFFAVYDGHGGHEVAQYSAQNLPQYLKSCEAYKKGDYIQALKDAFLGFDATLRTPDVIAVLKQIVKGKEESRENSASEDEENMKNLFAEAEMPLEQLMAKYRRDMIASSTRKTKNSDEQCVESELDKENIPEASGSGTGDIKLANCESDTEVNSSDSHEIPLSDCDATAAPNCEANHEPTSSNGQGDMESELHCKTNDLPDVEDPLSAKSKESPKGNSTEAAGEPKVEKEVNGIHDVNDDSDAASSESQSKSSNVTSETKGKISDIADSEEPIKNGEISVNEDKEDTSANEQKGKKKAKPNSNQRRLRKSLRQHAAVALYHSLLGDQDQSDTDSDEADESFKAYDRSIFGLFGRFFCICKMKIFSIIKFLIPIGVFNFHLSSEDEEGGSGKGEEAEEAEEVDDEEEEEDEEEDDSLDADDEDDDFGSKMIEEPGSDSGCTAVVALLKGQELYVANAGDSRCVVCRSGQAIEMSLDHKPEDECELERIEKAGGKVTTDGRVNGGLNLSRAIGDHAYKQVANLPPEEQMITALPDVRTLMIDPKEDEFMVLACDGIWNFMSSQDVVDFVRLRIMENPEKLSHICEELFDHCLAPSTVGDGTGCDNMTAVIVQFISPDVSSNGKTVKRCLSPRTEEENVKRPKTEVSTV